MGRIIELLLMIEQPSSWFLADDTYLTTLIVHNVHNDRYSARLQDSELSDGK